MKNKEKKYTCGNCLLYNHKREECKVAILLEGQEYHMPVDPEDSCHMEANGIEVQQVRWFVEDENGNPATNGKVKIEFPAEGFFNKKP